jgi:hypothetical protein
MEIWFLSCRVLVTQRPTDSRGTTARVELPFSLNYISDHGDTPMSPLDDVVDPPCKSRFVCDLIGFGVLG